MGYADPDQRYTNVIAAAGSDSGDTTTSYFHSGDEQTEGFRAAITRKRRSLFGGRPESMSSFTDLSIKKQSAAAAPSPLISAPIQGVLYHDLPERPSTNERRSTDPSGNRRSFFGGRFKLGRGNIINSPKREPSPHKPEPQSMRPPHLRGLSAPADVLVEPKDQRHLSEDEFYRNHRKQSISPPYNFEHVTHTRKKHLPALETVDEKDLTQKFWAASTQQSPKRQLKGIQADDLGNKLEAMGVSRGAVSSRPTTPSAEKSPSRPQLSEPRKSSSKEDITALPMQAKKSKRDELGAMLGLRTGTTAVLPKPGPERKAAHESALNALMGLPDKPKRSQSIRSNSSNRLEALSPSTTKTSTDSPRSPGVTDVEKAQQKPSLEPHTSSNTRRDVAAYLGMWESTMDDAPKKEKPAKKSEKPAKKKEDKRNDSAQTRRMMAAYLGSWEASIDEAAETSPKPKDEEKKDNARALPCVSEDRPSRNSKIMDSSKKSEINALLGIGSGKQEFVPMQPPAPPRPRRSDESLPALRREITPSAPDRPRRDSHDVQNLQNMGFGQLLHRVNSGESPHSPSSSVSSPHTQGRPSEDRRYRSSPREAESGEHFTELDQAASNRSQQLRYRSKQPLPAVPASANISPLQTVSEYTEMHSALPTPVDSAISPKSPTSMHSAQRSVGTVRSAELTGPGMPDDETWEAEIDFLYKQQAEATNDFDWNNVSMTPHRLSARDPDKRLSLNIPAGIGPAAALRLSKKLSEGSLRSSLYSPSQHSMPQIYEHPVHGALRNSSPLGGWKDDHAVEGARASPEVNVVDVDDQRSVYAYPVGALHMHGYESLAAGYLSDPESANSGSQHRKSNSYSSWESRPSAPKEQGRSSNHSDNSVPELAHSFRRGPKEPITSIYQLDQQQAAYAPPMQQSLYIPSPSNYALSPQHHHNYAPNYALSPHYQHNYASNYALSPQYQHNYASNYALSPQHQHNYASLPPQQKPVHHPMHDYAAFSKGPYGGYSEGQSPSDYVSTRRPEPDYAMMRAGHRAAGYDGRSDVRRHSKLMQSIVPNDLPREESAGWI